MDVDGVDAADKTGTAGQVHYVHSVHPVHKVHPVHSVHVHFPSPRRAHYRFSPRRAFGPLTAGWPGI